jgi:hypothetical protein
MANDDKGRADTTPHQYDHDAARHVAKKPAKKDSPQQEHDNEDQG